MDNFKWFLLQTTIKMVQLRERGGTWGTVMMDKFMERHTSENIT